MGKQTVSMTSDGKAGGVIEALDSNSSTVLQNPSKRPRSGPSSSVSSGQFKGVIPQQNGNWGAQIYANHQRIWLGTFKSEEEAAMAYDSAAIKLRSGDSHRNIPWTPESVEEPNFQSLFSQEVVLGMIRDGSYRSKFANYLRLRSERTEPQVGTVPNSGRLQGGGFLCRQIFQKELTPSDVGKLNRLVIPKKYAVKYLPRISDKPDQGTGNKEGGPLEDVQLVFYDRSMRAWKFRYCYWSSSQSFVFTRGWSRFVKEKALRANDTVSFYVCECTEPAKENRSFCMIDVCRNHGDDRLVVGPMDWRDSVEIEVESMAAGGGGGKVMEEGPEDPSSTKGFRLFGVQIN